MLECLNQITTKVFSDRFHLIHGAQGVRDVELVVFLALKYGFNT